LTYTGVLYAFASAITTLVNIAQQ